MKKEFTSAFMQSNRGCYDRDQMENNVIKGRDIITYLDFLECDIPLKDKYWFFCKKIFTIKQNQQISILCAERVLHIYEGEYPNDSRPRNAIEDAKEYLKNKSTTAAAYAAATAAAADAAADAAYAAATAAYVAATAAATGAATAAAADAAATGAATAAAADAAADAAYAAATAAYAATTAAADAAATGAATAAADGLEESLLQILNSFIENN